MSAVPAPKQSRLSVVIAGEVEIPASVTDLESFRRWAWSGHYPEHGWVSFLNGELWVDMSMEELLFHNQVKGQFAFRIMSILEGESMGRFVHDRMLLTHPGAGLSTEPDGLFYFWDTLRERRIRLVPRPKKKGYMELEGTPDMVLEVVSDSSVKKDTEILPDLYWRAGIQEYWLVDARGAKPRFDILKHTAKGYQATRMKSNWLKSTIFGRSFRLSQKNDPLGHPDFILEVRS